MAQNPWSVLDPDTQAQIASLGPSGLAKIGARALANGQITQEEAAKNAAKLKKAGLLAPIVSAAQQQAPSEGSELAMGINPQAQGDLSMQAGMAPGATAKMDLSQLDGVKNAFAKVEQDSSTKNTATVNRQLTRTPQDAKLRRVIAMGGNPQEVGKSGPNQDPIYDLDNVPYDPDSPYQQQKQGLDRLQGLAALQAQKEANSNQMDWTPLMKLADLVSGGKYKLAEDALKPTGSTAMASAMEIQKRRGELSKELSTEEKNQNAGSTIQQLAEVMGLKNTAGTNPRDPQALLEMRQAYMTHKNNVEDAKKDPVLQDMFGRYSVVNNSIANLTNAHNLTPQQFNESQQAIRTTLFPKGVRSGMDERAQSYLKSAGYNLDDIMQLLSNHPANIDQKDPDIQHIEELAQILKTNFQQQARKRLDYVTSGGGWVYDDPRYAHLAASLQDVLAKGGAQFAPTAEAQKGLNKRHAPGGTKAPATKTPPAVSNYDGSTPLPAGFTPDQKQKRLDYLKQKAGQ